MYLSGRVVWRGMWQTYTIKCVQFCLGFSQGLYFFRSELLGRDDAGNNNVGGNRRDRKQHEEYQDNETAWKEKKYTHWRKHVCLIFASAQYILASVAGMMVVLLIDVENSGGRACFQGNTEILVFNLLRQRLFGILKSDVQTLG